MAILHWVADPTGNLTYDSTTDNWSLVSTDTVGDGSVPTAADTLVVDGTRGALRVVGTLECDTFRLGQTLSTGGGVQAVIGAAGSILRCDTFEDFAPAADANSQYVDSSALGLEVSAATTTLRSNPRNVFGDVTITGNASLTHAVQVTGDFVVNAGFAVTLTGNKSFAGTSGVFNINNSSITGGTLQLDSIRTVTGTGQIDCDITSNSGADDFTGWTGAGPASSRTWEFRSGLTLPTGMDLPNVAFRLTGPVNCVLPANLRVGTFWIGPNATGAVDMATNNAVVDVKTQFYFAPNAASSVTYSAASAVQMEAGGLGFVNGTGVGTAPPLVGLGDVQMLLAAGMTFESVNVTTGKYFGRDSIVTTIGDFTIAEAATVDTLKGADLTVGGDFEIQATAAESIKDWTVDITGSGFAGPGLSLENVDASAGSLIVAIGATNVDGNTDADGIARGPAPDNNNVQFFAVSTGSPRMHRLLAR